MWTHMVALVNFNKKSALNSVYMQCIRICTHLIMSAEQWHGNRNAYFMPKICSQKINMIWSDQIIYQHHHHRISNIFLYEEASKLTKFSFLFRLNSPQKYNWHLTKALEIFYFKKLYNNQSFSFSQYSFVCVVVVYNSKLTLWQKLHHSKPRLNSIPKYAHQIFAFRILHSLIALLLSVVYSKNSIVFQG